MVDHARTPAPRPSTRVELAIPAELEDLVMDCLEKDPSRRPAGAAVIAERLKTVPLASDWTDERAARWWDAHRPAPRDQRPLADILLSHEGRQLRIGPRPRG
jgi:serine/threonine-protein kinase